MAPPPALIIGIQDPHHQDKHVANALRFRASQ
jgi:hypothetical protein